MSWLMLRRKELTDAARHLPGHRRCNHFLTSIRIQIVLACRLACQRKIVLWLPENILLTATAEPGDKFEKATKTDYTLGIWVLELGASGAPEEAVHHQQARLRLWDCRGGAGHSHFEHLRHFVFPSIWLILSLAYWIDSGCTACDQRHMTWSWLVRMSHARQPHTLAVPMGAPVIPLLHCTIMMIIAVLTAHMSCSIFLPQLYFSLSLSHVKVSLVFKWCNVHPIKLLYSTSIPLCAPACTVFPTLLTHCQHSHSCCTRSLLCTEISVQSTSELALLRRKTDRSQMDEVRT
jgi:hypothetical protein